MKNFNESNRDQRKFWKLKEEFNRSWKERGREREREGLKKQNGREVEEFVSVW